jgi:hypothetical protein
MTDPDILNSVVYEEFFSLTELAFQRYGSVFSLPVSEEPYTYLRNTYFSQFRGGRVLDFGCGFQKPLQKVLGIDETCYHSCDSDPRGLFSFKEVSDIPQGNEYDIIAANQVFEHLSFMEGIHTACNLARHVAPGGIMQIGVPNPQHPTRQMSNPTHITPWNYLNLCALLELGGLDPFYCARCNKVPGPRWYERPFVGMVSRVFRMDWCDTVYAVGRREK